MRFIVFTACDKLPLVSIGTEKQAEQRRLIGRLAGNEQKAALVAMFPSWQ